MYRTRALTVALLAAVACASPPTDRTVSTQPDRVRVGDVQGNGAQYDIQANPDEYMSSHLVPATADSTYLVTMGVYADLGIPISNNDPVNRIVSNSSYRIRYKLAGRQLSFYYDCGTSNGTSNANTYTLILNLSTQVVPSPNGGSTVHTRTFAKARQEGLSDADVRCASTGRIERLIVDRVMAKVLPGKPATP